MNRAMTRFKDDTWDDAARLLSRTSSDQIGSLLRMELNPKLMISLALKTHLPGALFVLKHLVLHFP